VVNQPRSWLPTFVVVVFIPFVVLGALPFHTATPAQFILPAAFAVLLALCIWAETVTGSRSVRIPTSSGRIVVTWRTAFFRKRRVEFPLERFHSVVSYNQPARYPRTRVELVCSDGARSLLLASYPADSASKSFWSVPRDTEASEACKIRLSVARSCGLRDGGFLGHRYPGEQVL